MDKKGLGVDDEKEDWEKMMDRFEVTSELVRDIEDARSIFRDFIFHQQYHIWVAEPNVGKTAIANYVAKQLSDDGYKVWYINLDASAPDLKYYQRLAEEGDYQLLAPLARGQSEAELVRSVDYLAKSDADLKEYVLFLDTLKKFTNVISKDSKGFYKKLRELTRKGLTVIALAHANKYRGDDDELIPEGTGDLKADCDNMSLMYKASEGNHSTVSTVSDDTKGGKKRASLKDLSFRLNGDRSVAVLGDYVDTKHHNETRELLDEHGEAIEAAKAALADGPLSESQFVKAMKNEDGSGPGRRLATKLGKRLAGAQWTRERNHSRNNAWMYTLIDTPR
ncbi:AAA family ATPase [Luminiphilus sp.]|nr:AAA family ATPase [Luminiphilus sp.]